MLHRFISFLAAFAATFVVLLLPAEAHHGWGGYRTDIEITLTVEELKLGNPHDRLIASDAEGQRWNLLLAPPARNRRFGFDETSLSVGDEVELFGRRHNSRLEIKVHCLFRDGDTVYTYRYNNGTSSLRRHGRDERC
ncbi:MAG: DUF6152 family protein [Pseudomonadota bacterium]